MTEEKGIERIKKYWATTRFVLYSGICVQCSGLFFTNVKTGAFCSPKCNATFYGVRWKGVKNPRWKGGRSRGVRDDGYVYLNIKGKQILEHRFVMEKHLGRSLKVNESIHHKNGVRNDNRIENLELWIKAQPAGQRLDDVIQFFVDNYEEELRAKLAKKAIV